MPGSSHHPSSGTYPEAICTEGTGMCIRCQVLASISRQDQATHRRCFRSYQQAAYLLMPRLLLLSLRVILQEYERL